MSIKKFIICQIVVGVVVLAGAFVFSNLAFGDSRIKQDLTDIKETLTLLELNNPNEILGWGVNTGFTTDLTKALSSTTSSIEVSSSQLFNGEEFTPSYPLYLTINPMGSNMEILECWGMTTSASMNSINECTRGLSFSGNGATSSVSSNQYAHSGGEVVAQTNVHYTFERLVDLDSNQTITGRKTFNTSTGIWIGDNSTSYDKYGFQAYNGDTNKPFCPMYDESANYWVCSNDGQNTIVLGGSSASTTFGRGGLLEASVHHIATSTANNSADQYGLKFLLDTGEERLVLSGSYYAGGWTVGGALTASSTYLGASNDFKYLVDTSGNVMASGTLTITGASSTFSNGIEITDGCFKDKDGICIGQIAGEYISMGSYTTTTWNVASNNGASGTIAIPSGSTKAVVHIVCDEGAGNYGLGSYEVYKYGATNSYASPFSVYQIGYITVSSTWEANNLSASAVKTDNTDCDEVFTVQAKFYK